MDKDQGEGNTLKNYGLKVDFSDFITTFDKIAKDILNKKIVEKYVHHGRKVYVKKDLKGKHSEFCLCHICDRFKPNFKENCSIAQALYENCVKFGVVTPVWECPKYKEPQEVKP